MITIIAKKYKSSDQTKRIDFIVLVVLLIVVILGMAKNPLLAEDAAGLDVAIPTRIISTSPSLTETLFALGLGDRIIAVSDYCRYPSKVERLQKIGGLFNPNIEKIVELRPDCVVLLTEHAQLEERLNAFGIRTITVDHSNVAGIMESFGIIAKHFDQKTQKSADELANTIQARLDRLKSLKLAEKPCRVLICIDRERGVPVSQVYAAGRNRYFNELLTLAGGVNVYAKSAAAVPTVSLESILEKNPDVIFDFTADWESAGTQLTDELLASYRRDWSSLGKNIAATRDSRVYPILNDFATVPGPRFIDLAETFAKILHPQMCEKILDVPKTPSER